MKESINNLVTICHKASTDAGWWTDKDGSDLRDNKYTFSNKIALCHSELSEALEADRKNLMDDKLPEFEGRVVEIADLIIRAFDLAGAYNMPLGEAVVAKLAFNAVRPDHKKENREAVGGKQY